MPTFNLAKVLNIPKLPIYLKQLDIQLVISAKSHNKDIQKTISRIITSRGKRLRPSLVFAIVQAAGQDVNKSVVSSSCAVELVHIASLIHDDIIDNSFTRDSKPTINNQEGLAQALLVGDFLLAKACQLAAKINNLSVELVSTSIVKLCEGQTTELVQLHNLDRSIDSYLNAIDGKSGSLISVACKMGGLAARLSETELQALEAYGKNFGISYQIIDDMLDLLSSEKLLGKPVGSDLKQGVYTMPIILSLAGANRLKLRKMISHSPINNHQIAKVLIADGSIQKTILQINKYNLMAQNSLKNFANNQAFTDMKHLPDAYLNWVLNNLVAEPFKQLLAFKTL